MQSISVTANRKFSLGQVAATPGAINVANQEIIATLIARHAGGDWGEVCQEDAAENELALSRRMRLISIYTVNGERLWVITEADRSVTTVLLPLEY